MSLVIETTEGDVTVDLFVKERPKTCYNFLKLCKIKYYNSCLLFKVEKDFVAQTGDPSETGRGGDSVYYHLYGEQGRYFEREFKPKLKHIKLGTLSMVNNGENMHGSQFFITLGENLDYLDADHTVFGEVVEGLDVLLKINESICDEQHRPYRDIRITHTVILDDPYDDPKHLNPPDASPEPGKKVLESDRIGVEEALDDYEGKTAQEVDEDIKNKEAKARATILEMIGDLPDADVKPPENVLFVCKLNPVTRDEDLEIIFSRFGPIKGCEVIRDQKSGESLQYAFIEFENEADCEKAFFKMDNVLIDDRRIHVDFSQSVSKIKWKGKGRGVEHFPDAEEHSRDKSHKDNGPRGNHDRNRKSSYREDTERRASDSNYRHRRPEHRSHASESRRSRSRERYNKNSRSDRSRSRDRNQARRERSRSQDNKRRHSPTRDRHSHRSNRRR
ncbi:Peptidyl-prolyl cis-trans isomerase-like 4 [Halotydeus destructor]|nr:Peptidyl-prolyl cis-trans isomerase-like 4 [Halotydeus destructor]